MRFLLKSIALLLFTIPISGYIITPISVPDFFLTSSSFGPLYAYQDDFVLSVILHTASKHLLINSSFYCGLSRDNLTYYKNYGDYEVENYQCTLTYLIPTHDYLSKNGLYCTINIAYDNKTRNTEFVFTLYPVLTNKTIYASNYKDKSFVVENISYYFNAAGLNSKKETISFPEYISYLDIDVYHRLELESVKFSTSISNPTCTSAYINIPDYDNIFPYINHNGSNYITVPLVLEEGENCWTFAYKNKMYVHPKTCQMSFEARTDFVLTNHFYLPINHKDDLLDQKISFRINTIGVGKTDIVWSLEYLAALNLIGNCEDSEYCVVGEEV